MTPLTYSDRKTLAWIVAALVVLLTATGCANLTRTHAEDKNLAQQRWRSARSSLILNMAQRQFDTGDLDQAEKSLSDAVAMDPGNAQLHLLGGRIQVERGNLERAANLFELAISQDPELPEAYYYLGMVLQRWQQPDKALENYQKAYDLENDNPAFLLAVSEMLVATGQQDEALTLLKDRAVHFDQNAGIRAAIGQVYLIQRKFDDAAEAFRQASLLRPDDTQITEALITAQIGAQRFDKATANLETLLKNPAAASRPDLKRTLAQCYTATGRYEDAKKVYLQLTREDPTDVDAWLALGENALALKDLSGALLAANRTTALAPRRHEGYLLAGLVWRERGENDRAVRLFDKAAELAPNNTLPLILRGLTLEAQGQKQAAAQSYTEALRRQPDDQRAKQLLANVTGNGG
ncbi:MAG: tetratricopeptide repeat protein [Phycisphaera sp.]|nr:tetratricopeptide repeat protein [Phycisphaera sp.]